MKIEIKHFWYRYQPTSHDVLRNVSFTIDEGSYWCLLGPNGSGKTTLLKYLAGLVPMRNRTKGEVTLDAKPISHWVSPNQQKHFARNLTLVPGTIITDLPLTVLEFVMQGRFPHTSVWSSPGATDEKIARESLRKVNLEAMADVRLNILSSGERQLVLIARALAQNPKVLLLDETTSNLDLHYQLTVFNVLAELNRQGTTIVIICHDVNLASEYCPNAAWLRHGEIVAAGPLSQTFTTQVLRAIYPNDTLHVGINPLTQKPKVFVGPSQIR